MGLKVLIVEDQFLEANNLKIILEKAGHQVCGVARSVDQALNCLKKTIPDIVMLDIFLKGDLTGIQLAYTLDKQNIPFIYLSANSNESTLEEAKLTQPYGFLVKPFRERELLITLDIAMYRYKQNQELINRQEKWLSSLLMSIINIGAAKNQKLLLLAKAFTSFLPFDYLVIDTDLSDKSIKPVYCFQRSEVDDYISLEVEECLRRSKLTAESLYVLRKNDAFYDEPFFLNSKDFLTESLRNTASEKIRKAHGFQSKLWVRLGVGRDAEMSITFYSLEAESYTTYHLDLMNSLRSLLTNVIVAIKTSQTEVGVAAVHVPAIPATQMLKPKIAGIIGNSPRLLEALDKVTQVAPFESTVLILGETGVGKEGLVQAIHELSQRKSKPLIKVNCAAIPVSLIESELFGHERGSFTGATDRRIGKFEQAQDGTLFLDEIGEMPLEVQSKLLRAIQEKEIERVGGRGTIKTNVRIIAATNRKLLKEVADGKFRMDLYYRLNVFPITLAPLRDRREDIPALVNHFLQMNGKMTGNLATRLLPEAMRQLVNYSWPGNIRELQHLIERHVVLAKNSLITSFDLSTDSDEIYFEQSEKNIEFRPIAEMDREHILAVLKRCNGKISGRGGAAELLQLPPTTLNSKMKKLGINWSYL
jgi:DNA-binding NtrC family response regulator